MGDGKCLFGAAVTGNGDVFDSPRCSALDVGQLGLEPDFSAELLDALDDVCDDGRQDVRPDVRLGIPKDFAGRAAGHERLQDQAMQRVFGSGGEFSVRERARAAQPELDIAFGVERGSGVEALDVCGSAAGVVAALDEERMQTGLGEGERSKETGAARPDDNRAKRGP